MFKLLLLLISSYRELLILLGNHRIAQRAWHVLEQLATQSFQSMPNVGRARCGADEMCNHRHTLLLHEIVRERRYQ
jgi:hypothetical protein